MSMMVPSERSILPTARVSEEDETEAAETPSSRGTGTGEVQVLPEAEAAARRDDGSDPTTPNGGRADGERRQQQPPGTFFFRRALCMAWIQRFSRESPLLTSSE